jgi:acyl-CoA reductase-like NAD-dependent aldehyde dehydrogenase
LIIGGKKIKIESMFSHISPVDTRITLGYFPKSSIDDIRNAINAARDSFSTWRKYDYKKRIQIFREASDILTKLGSGLIIFKTRRRARKVSYSAEYEKVCFSFLECVGHCIEDCYRSTKFCKNGGYAIVSLTTS